MKQLFWYILYILMYSANTVSAQTLDLYVPVSAHNIPVQVDNAIINLNFVINQISSEDLNEIKGTLNKFNKYYSEQIQDKLHPSLHIRYLDLNNEFEIMTNLFYKRIELFKNQSVMPFENTCQINFTKISAEDLQLAFSSFTLLAELIPSSITETELNNLKNNQVQSLIFVLFQTENAVILLQQILQEELVDIKNLMNYRFPDYFIEMLQLSDCINQEKSINFQIAQIELYKSGLKLFIAV